MLRIYRIRLSEKGFTMSRSTFLPLGQGIRKMTSLPAQRERLLSRGLLNEGYFADITVFDPAALKDVATYTEPARLPDGVKYVFVNGQLEFENGQLTGKKAGKALRRTM